MKPGATVIIVCLLVFCGLVAATVAWTAPVIEADLTQRAIQKLRERNLTFATVASDGRDIIVTGEVPNPEKRKEVVSTVASTWGSRVVLDRMVDAPPPAPPVVKTSTLALAKKRFKACQADVEDLLVDSTFFKRGSSRLTREGGEVLDDVVVVLKRCDEGRYEIEGHTDSSGDEGFNLRMSERRARIVMRALADRGIPTSRMTAIGYGSRRPVVSNDDPESQTRNRRIELRVLRKD